MAFVPSRNIVFLVFVGCIVTIGLAAIGRCSVDVAKQYREQFSEIWTETRAMATVIEEAFQEEPSAAIDGVKLCIRTTSRAWGVKWHPTHDLSEREMEAVNDRVWAKIAAHQPGPKDPVILAVVETKELGPIRTWKRHQAIVYGGEVSSEDVSDCLDD